MTPPAEAPQTQRIRVRVFVDFWNFSLSIREADSAFRVDWKPLGQLLTTEAGKLVDASAHAIYEGLHVYSSVDPHKPQDSKLKQWLTNSLDKMPGTHVVVLERQKKKGFPKCPACQTEVTQCSACQADMRGTEEKGVDTRMVTDMISLAWSKAYDVAVLVSADRDFVPVAEFLQSEGLKVVHGSFPPKGSHLSQKCWGNLNITKLMPAFKLAPKPTPPASPVIGRIATAPPRKSKYSS
jgi:uncharacterized LabA/DUF88 family protein